MSNEQRAMVDLIINSTPEEMTEKEKARLIGIIAAYLDLDLTEVSIVSVKPWNSIKVTVSLPMDAAKELLMAHRIRDPKLLAFLDNVEVKDIVEASEQPAPGVSANDRSAVAMGREVWLREFIQELASLIASQDPDLFEHKFRDRLIERIRALRHFSNVVETDDLDIEEVATNLKAVSGTVGDALRENIVLLAIEIEMVSHRAKTHQHSEAEDNEEVEQDPEIDGEENEDVASQKIRDKLEQYSFRPELKEIYLKWVGKFPLLARTSSLISALTTSLISLWTGIKAQIKAFLSAMGLEGIFLAIDRVAAKSDTIRYTVKAIGSVILPMIVVVMLTSFMVRVLSNPFKYIFRWIAREFDIQIEPDVE